MVVLQIIGGVVLALAVFVLLIYIYFRVKLGKFFGADVNQEPLSIHLNEDVSPEWLDDKKAKYLIEELGALGYKSGVAYSIFEMKDCLLQPFFKGELVAVVYCHKLAGCWVDIVIDEKGKTEYTFSSAPMGGGMEHRPECKKTFLPESGVSDLHALAVDIIKNSGTELSYVGESDFREYFENTYRKDIAWKNRKGGITFEEFLKTEKEVSFSSSSKNIELAFIQTKVNELEQWHETAIEEYRRSNEITEENFYELEYKLFIVPFASNSKAFLEYLEDKGFINESQLGKLVKAYSEETDIQALFNKINNLLSPNLRSTLIGECTFPLELKIFQLSEEMCS